MPFERERRDLARRVRALERRQIHHPDGEVEREQLRLALDRALGERRRPLLDGHRVDRADPRQPRLERKLEAGGERRRLGHTRSLALACLPRIEAVDPAFLPLERRHDELARAPSLEQMLERPPVRRVRDQQHSGTVELRRAGRRGSSACARRRRDSSHRPGTARRCAAAARRRSRDRAGRSARRSCTRAAASPRAPGFPSPRTRSRRSRRLAPRSDVKTAAIPSSRRRSPSACACCAPGSDRRPSSQPVAMPASLSVVVECVS